MLNDAAKLDIKPWIQKYSMKDANQAVVDMDNSKAKYRFVLVNESNGGKLQ
jgi:alcohol dehydrogenase (NADP+)